MDAAPTPLDPDAQLEAGRIMAWMRLGRSASLITLSLLLLCTLLAWQWAHLRAREQQQHRFHRSAEEMAQTLQGRLDEYALALAGARGLLAQGGRPTPEGWATYLEGLDLEASRPGLQGLGYALRLAPGEGPRLADALRASQGPGFRIWPDPARATSCILLLHPKSARNLRAIGFDMRSEAVRREAMDRAMREGRPILSGRVTLVQEDGRDPQAGALMYLPLYPGGRVPADPATREATLLGWVYSPFRMGDFTRATLGGRWPDLRIELHDRPSPAEGSLLFQSAPPPARPPAHEAWLHPAGGFAPWSLRVQSLPAFESGMDRSIPNLVLAAGIIISLLITGLMQALLNVRSRALELAGGMTAALREEQQRITRILDSTSEGIYGLDLEGRCTFVNRAFLALHGAESGELLGAEMHAACHHSHLDGSPYPVEACPIYKALHAGSQLRLEREPFFRKDGSVYWADVVVAPILENGRATGSVVTLEDVSHRQAVEQAKHDFISVVSHELRTPLTSVRGTLGLLASGRLRSQPEETERLLGIALRNAERLGNLINDILDFEKLRSGRMPLQAEPTEVRDLLAEAYESNLPYAAAREVLLHLIPAPRGLWIRVDRKRMVQALSNLLSNAAKFSPPGSEILLGAEPAGDRIRLRVADQGRGIPEAFQARLFEPFSQAESPGTRSQEGSGLGLGITKALVEDMGGTITFTSTEGLGTTFFLDFPALAPPPAP